MSELELRRRDSPRWRRVRAACCPITAHDIDPDEHADRVLDLIATASPAGVGSTVEGPSADADRQTKGA